MAGADIRKAATRIRPDFRLGRRDHGDLREQPRDGLCEVHSTNNRPRLKCVVRKRVEHAYELLFARQPDKAELKAALAWLRKPLNAPVEMTRWEQYTQVLLASNEMLYVD